MFFFLLLFQVHHSHLGDEPFKETAGGAFFSSNKQESNYKKWDYSCFAPQDHLWPEEWGTYDIYQFRGASTAQELEYVLIDPFDKSFNNWMDPEVFDRFLYNRSAAERMLWDSYDYSTKLKGESDSISTHLTWDGRNVESINLSACRHKCDKLVGYTNLDICSQR